MKKRLLTLYFLLLLFVFLLGTFIPAKAATDLETIAEALEQFLNENMNLLDIGIGNAELKYEVSYNYDSDFAYDIWIQTDWSFTDYEGKTILVSEIEDSRKFTEDQKETAVRKLREHQKKVYTYTSRKYPDIYVKGGYYHGWYKYRTIREGYTSRQFCSWRNYIEDRLADTRQLIGFQWYSRIDDYFEDMGFSMPPTDKTAMYRLYNRNSGEHFYTASEGEKNNLVKVGWKYEGIGWYAPKTSKTPVYRLYNPNAGDHHYTMNKGERDGLIKLGWNDEGIGWYSDDNKGIPLYRQYNPNAQAGSHNYTTDKGENDWLVSLGWQAEGIGWYGKK